MLAAIRPSDWNFPLLLHVLGAMLLVGGLVTGVTALILGWRRDSAFYSRFGFRALLFVAFPAWWLMRIAAEWIYSKENLAEDPTWVGIGYITSDAGGLLLLITLILTGIGARRLRRADGSGGGGSNLLVRIGTVLASLVLVTYLVTMWAMSAKPG